MLLSYPLLTTADPSINASQRNHAYISCLFNIQQQVFKSEPTKAFINPQHQHSSSATINHIEILMNLFNFCLTEPLVLHIHNLISSSLFDSLIHNHLYSYVINCIFVLKDTVSESLLISQQHHSDDIKILLSCFQTLLFCLDKIWLGVFTLG